MADRYLSLWLSGELTAIARQCRSVGDIAKKLGVTVDALGSGLRRLRHHGVPNSSELLELAWKSPLQSKEPDEWSAVTDPGIPPGIAVFQDEYGEDYLRVTGQELPSAEEPGVGVPFVDPVPKGFHVKGLSTLYDADGKPRAQWVKSNKDQEDQFAALTEAVSKLAEPFRGVHEPVPLPSNLDEDLLCVYPFGDPHFGLYSWAQETGEDFDLDIAERVTVGAIDHLVDIAPRARRALILSVGDTFHADSYENETQSGHTLDVDTRLPKVLHVAVRAYRRCVDRSLEKHEDVTVWFLPGNHDPVLSVALAMCLAQFYERDERVHVDTSPGRFRWYRFGKNLLGATHGDKAKPKDMAMVMACDRAQDWGETLHRRVYSGHLHHDRTEEFPGVVVDVLRTLAAKDAWHAGMGYRSGRDLKCDVYHREHGLISRHAVNVTQVLEQAA